jgi:L-alanine-DL-glutamate epimerase-like enolase superfamily enzyme
MGVGAMERRGFVKRGVGAGLLAAAGCRSLRQRSDVARRLERAAEQPILRRDLFPRPVQIASIELLRCGELTVVRARSSDGAFGVAATNGKVKQLYPILLDLVAPYFVGKDARDLEELLAGVYVFESNYKMSSLALWSPVCWVELSILDLLGRIAGRHVSEILGSRLRDRVAVYVASGKRETEPEEEVAILERRIAETGARAVKFKVGGRMSRDRDSMPGRSERLIELSRKILGDSIVIQADANGSYGVERAVEVGRRLEGIRAALFEEPCPFDWFEETRAVADALEIPVAGGEQESSEHRFEWLIRNGALQIVQPDLHYYGGFLRSTRVARMAAAAGLPITPHASSGNLCYADVANFCSFTPNIGPFHELKSGVEKTGDLFDPPLGVRDGFLAVPRGPGLGVAHVDELLRDARKAF